MLRRSGLARAVRDLGVRVRVQETSGGGESGGWLWSYLYGALFQGGGFRSFVMDGQGIECDEQQFWSPQNIDASNWRTTPEGGPFLELNGSDEYLRVGDNWTNQPGASNLLVATVFRPTSISGTATIIGKWDEASNDRSWILRREGATVQISTCKSGMSGDVVTLTSSYAVTTGAWIFVAGYWETATRLKLWIAKTTDEALTADENTTLISSELYAATGAYVTIGARSDELTEYLAGAVAPSVSRIGTPSDDIDEYVYGLFDLVRDGYWRYPTDVPSMYLLCATFAADDQAYADAQVLDTEAEGVQDGQLTVVEADGTLAVVSGRCAWTAQITLAWGDLGLYSQAVTRALGRGLVGTFNLTTWNNSGFGWHTAAALVHPDNFEHVLQWRSTVGQIDGTSPHGEVISGLSEGTDYQLALVLGGYDANGVPWHTGETPASYLYGAGLFIEVAGTWQLLYRDSAGNTATLYACLSLLNSAGTVDDFRVPDADLSAALEPVALSTFTADNGTGLDAITPEIGGVWSEELGGWEIQANEAQPVGVAPAAPEFMAVSDSGESDINLRTTITVGAAVAGGPLIRYDATPEFWYVDVNPATGNFTLYEYTGGGFIVRDNVAAGVGAGTYEVTVIADGQDITCFLDGVALLSWGAAATNETETQHGIRAVDLVPSFNNFHVHALRSDTYDDELDWL